MRRAQERKRRRGKGEIWCTCNVCVQIAELVDPSIHTVRCLPTPFHTHVHTHTHTHTHILIQGSTARCRASARVGGSGERERGEAAGGGTCSARIGDSEEDRGTVNGKAESGSKIENGRER